MPILQPNFQALPFEQQLPTVWAEGMYRARGWVAGHAVALYMVGASYARRV